MDERHGQQARRHLRWRLRDTARRRIVWHKFDASLWPESAGDANGVARSDNSHDATASEGEA